MSTAEQWKRFNAYYVDIKELKLSIDLSRMLFPDCFLGDMALPMNRAFQAMAELERGGIANPDEKRMVGHYWLRNPQLAPNPEIRQQIESTLADIHSFTTQIHSGTLAGKNGPFRQLLIIGIGGSALGPQFVAQALGQPGQDKLRPYFFDNTDPDGFDKVLGDLNGKLGTTLTIVISKSGGTKETRNGMLEAKRAYTAAGLDFAKHAVAITGVGSELDQTAIEQTWIHRFPMWDWVGGRTSEMSAVGLLPAALQGIDIEGLISGARACDAITRQPDHDRNPAALLALMWHYAGQGQGKKDMVILPYKDRLELFSKYLQQLVMESIGKELDLQGRPVYQGIAVYGNKGATDQHAYVQQLREGVLNFFVTFIEVLKDRSSSSMEVEPGVTSGDYLSGFLLGTREALSEKGRESITLTLDELTPFTVGVLIALYERAVGFYATLVGINAYHQPGVEAGKKAAGRVIALQGQVLQLLKSQPGHAFTPEQLGERLGPNTDLEALFKICNHLAANPARGVHRVTRGLPLISKFEYRP